MTTIVEYSLHHKRKMPVKILTDISLAKTNYAYL